jgi:hypothetical protein
MRTRPKISFDEEENKPLLENQEAAIACLRLLKGGDLLTNFEVDELFLKHYEKTTSNTEPTQKEINDFVIKLVKECANYEPTPGETCNFFVEGDTIKQNADS